MGAEGTALSDFEHRGDVFVHSERWSAITDSGLRRGQAIVVTGVEGLTLKVRPADD